MEEVAEEPAGVKQLLKAQQVLQHYLDKTVVWAKVRWGAFATLLVIFGIRVALKQGFFVVTYGLGIYLLNLFINFLSPAQDPETDENALPTKAGEFRPFTRKLPEFKFWWAATRAALTATGMTLFAMFDLPVYWPILLAYFILLFVLTMKDRVKHMIKYNYLPFSVGKQSYGESGKVKVPGAKNEAKNDK
ncbi:unnamed protein product [Polarella glacialis]|uniref:Protein RER1 n=1 Tax=Polarella glacialis TaxID=89957 RepID=A0A813JX53_POLGL|nr:unnamed protein product [Polarella glacialis]CAE8685630.1 unnamed protein product [Polarella glacialis]